MNESAAWRALFARIAAAMAIFAAANALVYFNSGYFAKERARQAYKTGIEDHEGVGQYDQPFNWYSRILALTRQRHIRVIGVRFAVNLQ
jgi:hypothetical protein